LLALRKGFLGRREAVEGRWAASINRQLYDHLDDLLARAADRGRALNMRLRLRQCAQRRQRRDVAIWRDFGPDRA